MRPLRVLALLLCVSTLALAASGCGGGGATSYSGTKPETWAATVCGAIGDWAAGLKADSQRLGSDLSGGTPIETVKAKVVTLLQNAERSITTLRNTVAGAGSPAVKNGAAIQQSLVSGLEQGRMGFKRVVAKAKKLPTNDRVGFMSGLGALAQEIGKAVSATGDEFNQLDDKFRDKSLNEAMSNEPSCSNIGA